LKTDNLRHSPTSFKRQSVLRVILLIILSMIIIIGLSSCTCDSDTDNSKAIISNLPQTELPKMPQTQPLDSLPEKWKNQSPEEDPQMPAILKFDGVGVSVQRYGSSITVQDGMEILVGDHITIGQDADATIYFFDGSVSVLDGPCETRYSKANYVNGNDTEIEIKLESGSVITKVGDLFSSASSHKVRTANTVVGAWGTVYQVIVDVHLNTIVKVSEDEIKVDYIDLDDDDEPVIKHVSLKSDNQNVIEVPPVSDLTIDMFFRDQARVAAVVDIGTITTGGNINMLYAHHSRFVMPYISKYYYSAVGITGNHVIWLGTFSGDYHLRDLYAYNLVTGEKFLITNTAWNNSIVLDGNRLVWEDSRNDPVNEDHDIYVYDLNERKESPACIQDGDQVRPYIRGDIVAWTDQVDETHAFCYGHNLATNETFRLSNKDSAQELVLGISDNAIVYYDRKDEDEKETVELWAYDIEDGDNYIISEFPTTKGAIKLLSGIGGVFVGQDIAVWSEYVGDQLEGEGMVFDFKVSSFPDVETVGFDFNTRQHFTTREDAKKPFFAFLVGGDRMLWVDMATAYERAIDIGFRNVISRCPLTGTIKSWGPYQIRTFMITTLNPISIARS